MKLTTKTNKMTKFNKNQEILRVENLGSWNSNFQIVKEEVYSCGAKQIILKDSDGGRGEKVSLTWFEEREMVVPFFNSEDRNIAELLKAELTLEAKARELKRDIRLGVNQ